MTQISFVGIDPQTDFAVFSATLDSGETMIDEWDVPATEYAMQNYSDLATIGVAHAVENIQQCENALAAMRH